VCVCVWLWLCLGSSAFSPPDAHMKFRQLNFPVVNRNRSAEPIWCQFVGIEWHWPR
jgi:hypothetical protein